MGHDDRVKAGQGIWTGKSGCWKGLNGLYPLKGDVVREKDAVLLYPDTRTGPHVDIFTPVMDHGKGELCPLLDIKFRYPNVQP